MSAAWFASLVFRCPRAGRSLALGHVLVAAMAAVADAVAETRLRSFSTDAACACAIARVSAVERLVMVDCCIGSVAGRGLPAISGSTDATGGAMASSDRPVVAVGAASVVTAGGGAEKTTGTFTAGRCNDFTTWGAALATSGGTDTTGRSVASTDRSDESVGRVAITGGAEKTKAVFTAGCCKVLGGSTLATWGSAAASGEAVASANGHVKAVGDAGASVAVSSRSAIHFAAAECFTLQQVSAALAPSGRIAGIASGVVPGASIGCGGTNEVKDGEFDMFIDDPVEAC